MKCNHPIYILHYGSNRVWHVGEKKHIIPDDFLIPTCLVCGNLIIDSNTFRRLGRALLPKACAIYLTNKDGKILGVSRKYNLNSFGLPGGKVDLGETVEQAAVREAKEETGLDISNLEQIFEHTEEGDYWTSYFAADYSGEINTTEKGIVRWVERKDLVAGTFGKSNAKLFASIDLINRSQNEK